ncbi:MAG: hypothetical protein SO096_05715 [Prevotella sp.]|nr:hypothetical protein [Prevotella sp.]MDY6092928.1 hypothetical protein [Prevotella sp.]
MVRRNNTFYGTFHDLLANTTKGLYYSTNGGRGWMRRYNNV